MERFSQTQPLLRRTVLIAPSDSKDRELAAELESQGAQVFQCAPVKVTDPESYGALDEAIENLFGYDWLIFLNVNAVDFFLRRFQSLGKEINDLDSLRVCAVGEATAGRLGEASVHVDVVPTQFTTRDVLTALEAYTGGRDSLRGLNFLIPRSASTANDFSEALENAGARADTVPAYRVTLLNDPNGLDKARINTLIAVGGIDCVVFTSTDAVKDLVRLFDTNDLAVLLKGVPVACIGDATTKAATEHGLHTDINPSDTALADAVATYFSH